MLGQEAFEVAMEHGVLLLSFVDNMGRALKTAKKPYVNIAMYNGHLGSEIYRLLHQDLAIYDFAQYLYINPVAVNQMKQFHDASVALLNELKLPINRPLVRKNRQPGKYETP